MSDTASRRLDALLNVPDIHAMEIIAGEAIPTRTPDFELAGGSALRIDPSAPEQSTVILVGDLRADAASLSMLIGHDAVAGIQRAARAGTNLEPLSLAITLGSSWQNAARWTVLTWLRDMAPENLDNELLDIELATELTGLSEVLDERGLRRLEALWDRVLGRLLRIANQTVSLDPASLAKTETAVMSLIQPRVAGAIAAAHHFVAPQDARDRRRLDELATILREIADMDNVTRRIEEELQADRTQSIAERFGVNERVLAPTHGSERAPILDIASPASPVVIRSGIDARQIPSLLHGLLDSSETAIESLIEPDGREIVVTVRRHAHSSAPVWSAKFAVRVLRTDGSAEQLGIAPLVESPEDGDFHARVAVSAPVGVGDISVDVFADGDTSVSRSLQPPAVGSDAEFARAQRLAGQALWKQRSALTLSLLNQADAADTLLNESQALWINAAVSFRAAGSMPEHDAAVAQQHQSERPAPKLQNAADPAGLTLAELTMACALDW